MEAISPRGRGGLVKVFVFVMVLALSACSGCGPTPPPQPPGPPADCTCYVPPSEKDGWRPILLNGETPWAASLLQQARDSVGDCSGATPEDNLKLIADKLAENNVCAAQWADAVLVAAPNGTWEEWHMVSYATGCWSSLSEAYKGSWTIPGSRTCSKETK